MKRGLIVLVILFVIQLCCYSQDLEKKEGVISTRGTATLWVNPDSARVFMGIETINKELEKAREINAKKIKRVFSAIKSLHVKNIKIKAPSLNVSLIREEARIARRENRIPQIIGYRVEQNFTILIENKKLKSLSEDVGKIIDTALKNGVNILKEVVFFKKDESSIRRKAIILAVEDAIENAKAIAKACGVKIKKYNYISTNIKYWPPPRPLSRQSIGMRERTTPTTIIGGEISIVAHASLNCSIE